MRLPHDRNEWNDKHLSRAITRRDRLFDQFERNYDLADPEGTADLYWKYMKADQLVEDIARVVKG